MGILFQAYDHLAKKYLHVEDITPQSDDAFHKTYQIFFDNPLDPGSEFDIEWRIFYPRSIELKGNDGDFLRSFLRARFSTEASD